MSTRRFRRWAALFVATVLVALATGCSGGSDNGPSSADLAEARHTVYELLDGGTSSLGAHAGQPVVVNFFGSWCAPCVAEMPDFEQVHQELGTQVVFVGLNIIDTPTDARGIVTQTGVTYEVGFDPGERIYSLFRGIGAPTTVVLRSDGTVSATHTGPLSKSDLRELIANATA